MFSLRTTIFYVAFIAMGFQAALNAMEEQSSNAQANTQVCYINTLPIEIISKILCYRFDTDASYDYFLDNSEVPRNFLRTCKKYYTNERLTTYIIKDISGSTRYGPIWTPLFIATPPAKQWLRAWINESRNMELAVEVLLQQIPKPHNAYKRHYLAKMKNHDKSSYNLTIMTSQEKFEKNIEQLLSVGVPINSADKNWQTAFMKAKKLENTEMQEFLIAHGAKE